MCIRDSPPRVQRGHVRRPGHSPQRTVSDDRRRGKHDEDCSDSNCGGGLGLRRGCDRRMRSSSLARSRDVPCSGRRKRHIRISETSAQISTRILCKSALLGGGPSAWGLSRPPPAAPNGPRSDLAPHDPPAQTNRVHLGYGCTGSGNHLSIESNGPQRISVSHPGSQFGRFRRPAAYGVMGGRPRRSPNPPEAPQAGSAAQRRPTGARGAGR